VRRSISEDFGAELLVYKDSSLVLGDTCGYRGLEAVVDHLFSSGDLSSLPLRKRAFPSEHLHLKRTTVVERKNVKRLVETDTRHDFSLYFS
jgi:hypothetical protein